MRAVAYHHAGPADVLTDVEIDTPTATGRDLLVQVEAVSVNPVDTKIRAGRDSGDGQPQVVGYDAVGVVAAIGDAVEGFEPGDRVWYAGAIDRPGTNSEYHLVDHRIVGSAPTSIDSASAAALPLTSLTAWELLFDRLRLPWGGGAGTSLLIVGGAGGVGSILVQLARQLTELHVIATASRPETTAWVEQLGAHEVIDHHAGLAAEFERIGRPRADYVISLTHTDRHFADIVEIIAPQGAIAVIDDPESLDVTPLKAKSVSFHWELMFTRSLFETDDIARQRQILTDVARLVDDGTVRSTATETRPAIDAANLIAAHRHVESGAGLGKVVLSGWPEQR